MAKKNKNPKIKIKNIKKKLVSALLINKKTLIKKH